MRFTTRDPLCRRAFQSTSAAELPAARRLAALANGFQRDTVAPIETRLLGVDNKLRDDSLQVGKVTFKSMA
jgi:hypothetical protein